MIPRPCPLPCLIPPLFPPNSPFLSLFDTTPLDLATRLKNVRLTRRLEAFGLFQGFLTLTVKPTGLSAFILGETQEARCWGTRAAEGYPRCWGVLTAGS